MKRRLDSQLQSNKRVLEMDVDQDPLDNSSRKSPSDRKGLSPRDPNPSLARRTDGSCNFNSVEGGGTS